MVKLQPSSNIDENLYPFTYKWDTYVRANYQLYQREIDRQTYHNQNMMRFPLYRQSKKRDSDIVKLNLVKLKQKIGQVQKIQMDLYQAINPSIRSQYQRTFNTGFIPCLTSTIFASSLFAFLSYCNISMGPRLGLTAVPLFISMCYNSRTIGSDIASTQFLDWLYNYRKAKSSGEMYKPLFKSKQLQQILKNGNLVEVGEQMVNSASA